MIYLDHAATSFYKPDSVAEAAAQAIRTMGNCSRGVHPAALAGARVIFETRELLAELFHAPGPEQVAFTANSTESLNMAVKGFLKPGDRAVTTVLEHNSVLRPLYEMEKAGVELEIVGCRREGGEKGRRLGKLDYDALEAAVTPGTKAVVITHASNLTGNRTDIRRVGQWCRRAGARLIVDASQTAGVFPIDMEKDGIDILCFTGHKGLMGPQGTGGICLGKDISLKPLLSGGSGIMTYSKEHPAVMPTALEAGTLNGHGIAGLRAALLYLKEQGLDSIRNREQALMRRFYEQIREIPGIRIYGDFEQKDRAAIVSLNLGEEDSGQISDYLVQEYDIYTRSGGHCAPLMHQALGTKEQGAVRFSFSHFNSEEDADMAAEALRNY
ncbi:MAG: aminotransferase class V-fold PLP-dependent enzyme [Enterocloster sp.]